MEINIKFAVEEDGFVLSIGEKEIKIDYVTKTFDSRKLYDYLFSNVTEPVKIKYHNLIDNTLDIDKYEWLKEIDEEQVSRIRSEGYFISEKIETLINSIVSEINEILTKEEESIQA